MGFDVTEVKGEAESDEGEQEGEPALAEEGEKGDGRVADDAKGGDGDAEETEWRLWLTMPQSQWALMSQGWMPVE